MTKEHAETVDAVREAIDDLDAIRRELEMLGSGKFHRAEPLDVRCRTLAAHCAARVAKLRLLLPQKGMELHARGRVECAHPDGCKERNGLPAVFETHVALDMMRDPAAVEGTIGARLRAAGWTDKPPYLCILHNADRGN